MPTARKRVDELAKLLEKTGGDAERLEVLKQTQKFRRSWIELAEVLRKVEQRESYAKWGFSDFYSYCQQELGLKRTTVSKLLLSLSTLHDHAPEVLRWDGVAKTIPSYETVDYFTRAVGESQANTTGKKTVRARKDTDPQVLADIKQAIFTEGTPIAEIRKRFDPILFPKPSANAQLALIQKASLLARKLAEVLPSIDGLAEKSVHRLEQNLGSLREQLDQLASEKRNSKPLSQAS